MGKCVDCGDNAKFITLQKGYVDRCFSCSRRVCVEKAAASRRANYRPAWNAGLTKNDDERVAKISIAIKKNVEERDRHWNAGRSKKTHEYISRAAEKRSKTVRTQFKTGGRKAWHVGRSRLSDPSLAAMGNAISKTLKNGAHWSYDVQKAILVKKKLCSHHRLDDDTIRERLRDAAKVFDFNSDKIIDEYDGADQRINVTCRNCDAHMTRALNALFIDDACPKCTPGSRWQREVYDFVRSLDVAATIDDRTVISPLELDVWSEKHKFAVECHGLYWHNELRVDNNAHERKLKMCKENDIRLLQLFEDEWRDKRAIVESMIKHRMGHSSRIFARKCKVEKIEKNAAHNFLNRTHIDGSVRCQHAYGLFYEDKLVGAITLRKPRHKKWKNYIEVARVAFDLNTQVVGGSSKLLSRCKQHGQLLSYVDSRFGGEGRGYKAAGFKRIKTKIQPRFWWTDFRRRYNRFTYRADKKKGLSQAQIAKQNGVVKIWGTHNLTYIYDV